jgi:arylsulfatase A-like enzyme
VSTKAILLLIDGLRSDVAEAELAAGQLPHLAALTARGTRTVAATAFPSTTSVAYLPFLTGCLPGRCNVPSIRWLDRQAYRGRWWTDRDAVRSYCGWQAGHLNRDIASDVTTIFELVPESVAIFSMVTRGLAPEADRIQGARKFWGTVSHYTENHQPGDDAVARELVALANGNWRFCFAQFPAVDGHTHAAHPSAPRVLDSLRKVDATIGRLVAALAAAGRLEETMITIVSDHGAAGVHRHLDLATWFRTRGVRTLAHPVVWTRDPEVAVMVAGNAQAALYAKPGVPRAERLTMDALRATGALGLHDDAVAQLCAEPGIALVAAEDGAGGVRVASAMDEATITHVGDRLRYVRASGDPLQVGADAEHDHHEWLARTIDGPFPDAPTALWDQFRASRTGDLVIAASAGWDFRDAWEYPEHKSGHGSLIAEHVRTPLWSNVPLPERAAWRTVDVFPRLCEWLGVETPQGIDGR